MKHVDEGLLHAYLDQAMDAEATLHAWVETHLAACEQCRAHLDEAREIRDATELILQDLGLIGEPVVPRQPAPIPVELSARRDAGALRQSLGSLALAASLVVALGGAWVLREHLVQVDTAVIVARSSLEGEAAGIMGASPKEVSGAVRAPADEVPTEERSLGSGSYADDAGAQGVKVVTAAAESMESLSPPAASQMAAVQDAPPATAAIVSGATPPAAPSSLPEAQIEGSPVPLPGLATVNARENGVAERSVAGPDLPRAGTAPSYPLGGRRPGPPGRRPSTFGRPNHPMPERSLSVAWTRVSQPEAEHRLGERLLYVEELSLIGIWVAQDRSGWKVQMFQILENGAGLELVQWRESGRDLSYRERSAGVEESETDPSDALNGVRVIRTEENRNGYSTVLLRLGTTGSMLSLTAAAPLDSLLDLVPRLKELR